MLILTNLYLRSQLTAFHFRGLDNLICYLVNHYSVIIIFLIYFNYGLRAGFALLN